jgi:hypothetical protein
MEAIMGNSAVMLSKHFSLAELTVTKSGIKNTPSSELIISRLRKLCDNILEKFGMVLMVR